MPSITSRSMGVKITGNATSVLSDISTYTNQQAVEFAVTLLEDAGMGDDQHKVLQGMAAAPRFPLNGRLNSTIQAIFGNIAQGTSVQKQIELQHGAVYYNATCELESYQESGSLDTIATWSVVVVAANGANKTSVAL